MSKDSLSPHVIFQRWQAPWLPAVICRESVFTLFLALSSLRTPLALQVSLLHYSLANYILIPLFEGILEVLVSTDVAFL